MTRVPLVCILIIVAGGCSAPRGPFLASERDPANKIPGIVSAVQREDLSAAKHMVADLDSDDAAVRLYAIEGLHRLTGENFGYNYYDDDLARQPAIGRWQEWLKQQEQGK